MDKRKLKQDYRLAACCSPSHSHGLVGYYSHDNVIKIHSSDCPNLTDADPERLIQLTWDEVIDNADESNPGEDYESLDTVDFSVLKHHLEYDIDYSLVVARKLNIPKEEAFERHRKLREMTLIERVEATMVQYRKGIVDNKWIKHRNHTYYRLTPKGRRYIEHFLKNHRG